MSENRNFGKAIKWAYLMNWGEQGLSGLLSFVLAAIIGPGDFGIVAIALVYILFLQMFLDQGLVAALIQKKDLDPEHLDSVFWMVLAISTILVGLSLGFSPWWSAANHLPKLATIISLLSITIPIEALTVVQKALFQRNMDFKSLSIRSNISFLLGGLVGVGMALKGFGPYSLVGQRITQDVCALTLLWGLSHWRPRFRFSLKCIKDLLSFSLANFAAKIGVFANVQSEAFFMGIFFGPVAVGLYRFAQRLVSLVLQVLTSSLQVASFPQFSRLQDKPEELRKSVQFCIRMSTILTLPILAGIAGSSRIIVSVVGTKWMPAVPVLALLALGGIVSSFIQFTGPLLQARSKPHLLAFLCWIDAVLVTVALVSVAMLLRNAPVSKQILGIALARLLVSLVIDAPLHLVLLFRVSQITIRQFFSAIMPAIIAATGVAGLNFLITARHLDQNRPPVLSLAICAALSAVVAGGLLYLTDGELRKWAQNPTTWQFVLGGSAKDSKSRQSGDEGIRADDSIPRNTQGLVQGEPCSVISTPDQIVSK